jgi:hypothetical protein
MSTNKSTRSTITFKTPFSKVRELCVITPSQQISPKVNTLLAYAQILYENTVKGYETANDVEPIQANLFEKAFRSAYPGPDPSGDQCEESDIADFTEE